MGLAFCVLVADDRVPRRVKTKLLKRMPVVLWLHGLGDTGDGWRHLPRELRLSGDFKFIFPDAPVQPVSCNGGFKMTSWMDLDEIPVSLGIRDDEVGLASSTKIVHDIIKKEMADNGTPSTDIVIGGFSQGGAMALLAGFTFPQKLAGVVCFSGWPALQDKLVERTKAAGNADTPAFVAHGTADEVVLPECGAKAAELLKQSGVPVTFKTYERMGHSSCSAQMAELKDWLEGLFGPK